MVHHMKGLSAEVSENAIMKYNSIQWRWPMTSNSTYNKLQTGISGLPK